MIESTTRPREKIQRISISIKDSVYRALDRLVEERGFGNRSQAISEMINQSFIEHSEEQGSKVMAGTITIFYDSSKPGLLEQLAEIERQSIAEVISSQHVMLENEHKMEVLLVQGPAGELKQIADRLITCKGVLSGQLVLTSTILPPIHTKVII